MHKVIDSPWQIGQYAAELKAAGAETIIRYYNHTNSTKLPQKRIEQAEFKAILEAGLSLAVVFQQRGGAQGNIGDLTALSGDRDGKRALALAQAYNQPQGSAIYFAVDHDYYKSPDLASIVAYFKAAVAVLDGAYRIGIYGSGTVGAAVRDAGAADFIWLAGATGWSGTKAMLKTDEWALYQLPKEMAYKGVDYDGNFVGSKWTDFGQFHAGAAAAPTIGATPSLLAALSKHTELAEVSVATTLNLRGGPGTDYPILSTLGPGTHVVILERSGSWAKIDLKGDGSADGYVSANYLKVFSGGFPVSSSAGNTPYDVARAELKTGVAEVSGPGNNPRIVMYHRSTNHGAGTDDHVAWCSSFVNFCVEQAGMIGTNSQAARSWQNWGQNVSANPREGDIAVFARGALGGVLGHVGFFVEDLGSEINVLGGNQSNRVCYKKIPKNGPLGGEHYQLLSIRRG